MNILESCIEQSPFGVADICANFTIDQVRSPFVLHNITRVKQQYTLSLWVKSSIDTSITVYDNALESSNTWSRHELTFTATSPHLKMYFDSVGDFYIWHPQLEIGNKASDWVPAPEDTDQDIQNAQDTANKAEQDAADAAGRVDAAESIIQQLKDRISMLVTDENGTTLWEQSPDSGWTFSMADTRESIESIQAALGDLDSLLVNTETVEKLTGAISGIESSISWVQVTEYEGLPCIALGQTGSDFQLLITNEAIMFVQGSSIPAYISNQALNISKAVIEEELHQGPFVWKVRANGNMGLLWKGGTS